MKRFACCVLFLTVGVAGSTTAQEDGPPKLVVFVSVDQMRADYLERFGDMFEGGFAKLLAHGASFTNVHHEHGFTQTAPGHATLATGVFPSRHGIVDNVWYDRDETRNINSVEDLASPIVGFAADTGRSPANLLRETVGDWLKQASPESKVFSLSVKDRAAVLLGGKKPDGVYWYHGESGKYVTSQYYRDAPHPWVDEFNDRQLADQYILDGWRPSLKEDAYEASREDDFPAEDDSTDAAFPHLFDVAVPDPEEYPDSVAHPEPWHYSRLRFTPFPDHMTFELARQVVKAEQLGADGVPDLLLIGASSGDYIGHDFGPMSWEMQDYYHHLDRMLAELFEFLDDEVGSGEYAVVLSSDHGMALLAEESARQGMDASRIGTTEFQTPLVAGLQVAILEEQIYGQPRLSNIYPFGLNVTFTDGIPGEPVTDGQMKGLRRVVADSLRTADVLEDVFTYDQLKDGTSDSPYFERYRRSFHPDRAADLVLRLKENYTMPRALRGNHGSPYEYDTHVPLIVVAPGVERSTVDRRIATVSVAPTVAALLGIAPPGDLDGGAIVEVAGGR